MTDLDAYLTSLPESVLSSGETRIEVQRHLPLICAADEGYETYEVEVTVEDCTVSAATWMGAPFPLTPDEQGQAVYQVDECYDAAEEHYRDDDADELACERARETWEARWRPE